MSHFSPVPPSERQYAKNYRMELEPFEAQLVEVSGRVKEFRDHPERKDLQTMLLVNVQVRPLSKRKLIKLTHLWVLTKHVRRAGLEPKRGRRIGFIGSVYAYFRLGGKSKQRSLHGTHDFSILPMEGPAIETFEPGINTRYETENGSANPRGAVEKERGSGGMGEGAPSRSQHSDRRRRDHRSSVEGSEDRDRIHRDDKQRRSRRTRRSRKPKPSDPA